MQKKLLKWKENLFYGIKDTFNKVINIPKPKDNMCERESHATDVRIVVTAPLSGRSVPLAFILPSTTADLNSYES